MNLGSSTQSSSGTSIVPKGPSEKHNPSTDSQTSSLVKVVVQPIFENSLLTPRNLANNHHDGFVGKVRSLRKNSSQKIEQTISDTQSIISLEEKKKDHLTLQNFCDTLKDHPNATRLIVREKGYSLSIEPLEGNNEKISKEENKKAIQALELALQISHSPKQANKIIKEVLQESLPWNKRLFWSYTDSDLSSEKLREILQKADHNKLQQSTAPTYSHLQEIIRFVVHSDKKIIESAINGIEYSRNQADNAWKVKEEAAWKLKEQIALLRAAQNLYTNEKEKLILQEQQKKSRMGKAAEISETIGEGIQQVDNLVQEKLTLLPDEIALFQNIESFLSVNTRKTEQIAGALDVIANIGECVNLPFVNAAALFNTAASALRFIDQRNRESDLREATSNLHGAFKKAQETSEIFKDAEKKAFTLEKEALEREKQWKDLCLERSLQLAQIIYPPENSASKSVWIDWTRRIAKAAKIHEGNELLESKWSEKLVSSLQQEDLLSLKEMSATVWNERIFAADETMRNLQNPELNDQKKLRKLETVFRDSWQRAKEAKEEVDRVQKNLDELGEEQQKAEEQLIKFRQELADLQEKCKIISHDVTSFSLESLQQNINQQQLKRTQLVQSEEFLKEKQNCFKEIQFILKNHQIKLEKINQESIRHFELFFAAQKPFSRRVAFFQFLADTDRAAFAKNWPSFPVPEVLSTPRLKFLKQLLEGVLPSMPWKGILPGILEEVGLITPDISLNNSISSDDSNDIETPAELENSTQVSIEKLKEEFLTIIHQEIFAEKLDWLNIHDKEKERWIARKKLDDLESKVANLNPKEKKDYQKLRDVKQKPHNTCFESGAVSHVQDSSAEENKVIRQLIDEKEQAYETWNQLMCDAEKNWSNRTYIQRDLPKAISYWRDYDQMAILSKTWNDDITRWQAAFEMENWSQRYKKAERELNNELLKKIEEKSISARKKWSLLASETLLSEGKGDRLELKRIPILKNRLRKADRAVQQLWDKIVIFFNEDSEDTAISFQFPNEEESYEAFIVERREQTLQESFHDVVVLQNRIRDARKNLALLADIQIKIQETEIVLEKSIEIFKEKSIEEALEDVRSKEPAKVLAIWDRRVIQSGIEAAEARGRYDLLKGKEKNEESRIEVNRLIGIANVEKEAYNAAKKEIDRLDVIEKTWKGKIQAADLASKLQIEAAVCSYKEGDSSQWLELPAQWRRAFNQMVFIANNKIRQEQPRSEVIHPTSSIKEEELDGLKEELTERQTEIAKKKTQKLLI